VLEVRRFQPDFTLFFGLRVRSSLCFRVALKADRGKTRTPKE